MLRCVLWFAVPLALLQASCTFYTSCPCAEEDGNGNGGTGGTGAGTGGAGGGGSGTGGSVTGPIPTGEWVNVTSNLSGIESTCGNLSHVAVKPDEDMLIAGVGLNGLWKSTDGGESWESLGQGEGSDEIINRTSTIVFDPDDTSVFWESGTYDGAGIYKTEDDGETFQQIGTFSHNDVITIDFTDPDRQTMLVSGHEQNRTLSRSTDGGETWDDIGGNIPAGAKYSSYPYVLDASTFLLGCSGFGEGEAGIFRSVDAGESWTKVSDSGGYFPPLPASDGSIYWSSELHSGLVRSEDDGETWDVVTGGGVLVSARPAELPDGRIAAMTGDTIVVSDDRGTTWHPATAVMPFEPQGMLYSAAQRAFFIFHNTCGFSGPVPVPDDAIMRYDFDYETE
jgi:hypothetical protein